jgi:predicted transcriptional regulator
MKFARVSLVTRMVKFSAQMDSEVLERLREHAARTGRTLSWVMTQASAQYLQREQLREPFVAAADEILDEYAKLLERLAR